jgi:hypothetical protein
MSGESRMVRIETAADGALAWKLKEAAKHARMSERSLWGRLQDGAIPYSKVDRHIRIRPEAIKAFLIANEQEIAAQPTSDSTTKQSQ